MPDVEHQAQRAFPDMTNSKQSAPPAATHDTEQTSTQLEEPTPTSEGLGHYRRPSGGQHGVTKNPVKLEQLPELDDFGLPVRSTRTSRANSVIENIPEEREDGETEAQPGKISSLLNGALAFRKRSQSSRGDGRSRSRSAVRDNAIHEDQEAIPDESGRGRKASLKSLSGDTRTAAGRSRSLAGDGRPGSRSRSRAENNGRTRADSMLSDTEQKRSRASTTSKVMDSGGAMIASGGISEWSHQALAPKKEETIQEQEEEWQDMPALGEYDVYDDDGKLVAKGAQESDEEGDHGGASKGYTRVQIDDDAKSTTSMDENTNYLFKEKGTNVVDDDEEARDPLAQMQATKDLLTEGQRIAYVGVARLAMIQLLQEVTNIHSENKQVKKDVAAATEAMKLWSQKMMVRLYGHMDIDAAEQVMIEQLADHGVVTSDLTPALLQSARVKNPMAEPDTDLHEHRDEKVSNGSAYATPVESPSLVQETFEEIKEVKTPAQMPSSRNIDIDIRWTVLCDLFLVLIADAWYDARSRQLLETVGQKLNIEWLDVCRFEKRITDALEMQEEAAKENWDEAEHMEERRKKALKRKYMYMGLATVGGSLIIGLSAGLLAPVIGAGLAAGFTTIGVAGTSGFLAGAGGTALITTIGVTTGGSIAVKASGRRMGAVRTFEYRPLHNNKRVNLIVTVSGWMNGKVDDVRLPFSTVDPIMGDLYSIHWEPDMLQSIGDTVRILATEALTSGLQQVLAATLLTTLMAAIALPVWLAKLSYLVDNPWSVSMNRADSAGLILADSLHAKNLGARPITLVGFSLGARVIFSCLKELANKGAHGLVQNVYLFGSPIVANVEDYNRARTVIAGRFVNAYATNDWILGYLFRATKGGISRVAGLKAVENVPGLENLDVTAFVQGHMAYRAAMPRLLRHVGWEVESDEFDEIIDPDPENHEARQRELIKEIEDARKEAELRPEKKRFAFFRKGKPADKKNWETYDEKTTAEKGETNGVSKPEDSRILFDIEAIKRELASEAIEVKQLESTLPPLQIISPKNKTTAELEPPGEAADLKRRPSIQLSGSYDDAESEATGEPKSPDTPLPRERSPSLLQRVLPRRQSGAVKQDTLSPIPVEQTITAPTGEISPLPSAVAAWRSESRSPSPNPTPTRPELTKVHTMPEMEKNAWNDEEDDVDGWGKERQVVMSFE